MYSIIQLHSSPFRIFQTISIQTRTFAHFFGVAEFFLMSFHQMLCYGWDSFHIFKCMLILRNGICDAGILTLDNPTAIVCKYAVIK